MESSPSRLTTFRGLILSFLTVVFVAGCSSSSSQGINADDYANEIVGCVGELQGTYPNASNAALWVVCEEKYWSDKQDVLAEICSSNPDFTSCAYQK